VPEGLELRVEDGHEPTAIALADQLRIEAGVDVARERSGENDVRRSLRKVGELLAKHVELVLGHLWPPLVDLRVDVRSRVEHGRGGPRLAADADEVVEDPFVRQLLGGEGPGPPARQTGADDRHPEAARRTRDVDPLAARARRALARAVALPELEVRHEQRAVDRSVESDGDDHQKGERLESMSPASSSARPAYQRTRAGKLGSPTVSLET